MNTMTALSIEKQSLGNGSFLRVVNKTPGTGLLELDVDEIKQMCREHAGVIFAGFDAEMSGFEAFTEQLCSKWMDYEGGAHDREVLGGKDDSKVYSVNIYLGRETQYMWELPMHSDMSYQGYWPKILFFYCVTPAKSGGETAMCDGRSVYRGLSDETREFFHTNRIRYIRTANWRVRFHTEDLEDVKKWCRDSGLSYAYDADTDVVTTEYITSALPTDMRGETVFCNSILPVLWQEDLGSDKSLIRSENGEPFPQSVIDEIRAVTAEHRVTVKLGQQDVVWIDNTRSIHGRMAFEDPDRNVGIRMGAEMQW